MVQTNCRAFLCDISIISIFFDMSILNCSTVIFPPEAAPLPRSLYVPGMFPGFLLQMLLKPYHLLPGQTAQSLFPPSSMKFYI